MAIGKIAHIILFLRLIRLAYYAIGFAGLAYSPFRVRSLRLCLKHSRGILGMVATYRRTGRSPKTSSSACSVNSSALLMA
jgi:hypothetical protein